MSLCQRCGQPGEPYTYRGIEFDGLHSNRGERLCSVCLWADVESTPIRILVVDDRPSVPPYVWDSIEDRDKIRIFLPAERRGIDGRDTGKKRRKKF